MLFFFLLFAPFTQAADTGLSPEAAEAVAGRRLARYSMRLRIEESPPSYRGSLDYTGFAARAADRVDFEILPNTPRFVRSGARPVEVTRVRQGGVDLNFSERDGLLEVRFEPPLAAGQRYSLTLDFEGALPVQPPGKTDLLSQSLEQLLSMLAGEGSSDYGMFSSGDGILSLGRFFPAALASRPAGPEALLGDARTLELADYDLELDLPASFVVASGGVLVRSSPAGPGRASLRIRAPASRDLALTLSPRYEMQLVPAGGVLVRSFYDRDHAARGRLALDTAVRALQVYTEAFGPYPYTELDVAEAPLYGGAAGLEFPGFVTVANLFYRPAEASATEGAFARAVADLAPVLAETMEFVVAHEVAHQWWNATVASDSLRHPYLDEALANFSALLYFERVHGPEAAARQAFLQMRFNYQVHRLAGGADAPVNWPASRYADILQYAAVVYGKGGLFFPAMRQLIGEAAFLSALRGYYRDGFLGFAGPEDLRSAFLRAASDPLAAAALHRRWIEEAHGDEDLGRVSLLRLSLAMPEPDLETAGGAARPRDPVEMLMRAFDRASR